MTRVFGVGGDNGTAKIFFGIPSRLWVLFVYNQKRDFGNVQKPGTYFFSTQAQECLKKDLSLDPLSQHMFVRRFIIFIVMVVLVSPVMLVGDADAKRKKRRYSPPPLKILDISTSPMPFAPGNGPLTITVDVGLPKNLSDVDLLEVSSMISFPTKRSIRFLYNRLPIEEIQGSENSRKISTTFLWDGKDHTDRLVSAGTYKYEIRAKLMSKKDGPARVKIVSLRARGDLEVSPPESLATSKAHLEHVPFKSDDDPSEKLDEGSGEGGTAVEEVPDNEDMEAQEPALEEVVTGGGDVSAAATLEAR